MLSGSWLVWTAVGVVSAFSFGSCPFWLGVGVDSAFVVLVGPRLGWFNTGCAYTHGASDRSKLASVGPTRLPRHSSAVRLTVRVVSGWSGTSWQSRRWPLALGLWFSLLTDPVWVS